MDEPVDMTAGDADIGQHGVIGAIEPSHGAPAADRTRTRRKTVNAWLIMTRHLQLCAQSHTAAVDLSNK